MPDEEVELIDYLRVIWKRRWLIVGSTLACMLAALTVSLLLSKVYEVSLHLKVGELWEQSTAGKVGQAGVRQLPIDDAYRVAEIINSEPFLDKVRQKTGLAQTAYEIKKDKIVVAEAVQEGKQPTANSTLVNVVARAHAPEKAVKLVEAVADLIIREHKPRFDKLMKEHNRYESELENQVKLIQKQLDELDATIKRQRTNPKVNAPAVILLQAQLEEKQTRLVGLVRELRDVRMLNARSENTTVVLPPVLPENHVNPKTTLNVLIAGIVGLITVLMLAFFLEYLEQVKLREQTKKEG